MKTGIPTEVTAGETRVAATPETVRRLARLGLEVLVQSGAGLASSHDDDAYAQAGAAIVPDAGALYAQAELLLKVLAPAGPSELDRLRAGQTLVSFLHPLENLDLVQDLARRGVTSFAMDAVPRITAAQSMDALSSMSTLAGYKAVMMAADALPKLIPMLMTAAGTIQPAQVFVIGAGVAGLQAIATARRLGAVVTATDTRPAVQEQVESLGAKFVGMESVSDTAQGAGGYAHDLGEQFYRKQQESLAPHVQGADIVITTALVPGRRPPLLITEAMVRRMRSGSVIVDLAAEGGGNCALTRAAQRVTAYGVTVVGPVNLAAAVPVHASQMYARNIAAFVGALVKDGQLQVDRDNPVLGPTLITQDGQLVHDATRQALERSESPGGEPEPRHPPTAEKNEDNTTA